MEFRLQRPTYCANKMMTVITVFYLVLSPVFLVLFFSVEIAVKNQVPPV